MIFLCIGLPFLVVVGVVWWIIWWNIGRAAGKALLNQSEQYDERHKNDKIIEINKKAALYSTLNELDKWYKEAKDNAYKNYLENYDRICASQGLAPKSYLSPDLIKNTRDNYNNEIANLTKTYQSQKNSFFKS